MNSVIRIVAAVLDTTKLTLYEADGTTICLQQGDSRIRRIVDEAAPQIAEKGYADVNMAIDLTNAYKEFEEKSNKVRFFRVAKEKLKNLFGFGSKKEEVTTPDEPIALGPEIIITGSVEAMKVNTDGVISKNVIDEIMQHATPASHVNFNEEGLDKQNTILDASGVTPGAPTLDNSPDTIIAVTTDNKIIPGMERIKTQFARAAKLGSTVGVEKFLERLGKVIHERRHSIDDLLKFLERGDLPIADDGTILIYKVLNQTSPGKFVDCHSGNVKQWVGARVMMAQSLVDPNRNNECSYGLHVARRGYIRSFSGSACVLAKLAPEDVIAVPAYDANKMRVCAYHIIFQLSNAHYEALRQSRPITENSDGQMLLAKALRGDHTRVTHIVEITEARGGGVQVHEVLPEPKKVEPVVIQLVKTEQPLQTEQPIIAEPIPEVPVVREKLVPAEALRDELTEADPVDPREVVKTVESLSNREKVQHLIDQMQSGGDQTALRKEILQIKKKAKVGWERLGVSEELGKQMTEEMQNTSGPAVTPAPVEIPEEKSLTAAPSTVELGSYSQRIKTLASISPMDAKTAQAILEIKKKSKKGWSHFELSDSTVEQIQKLTSK
jgi:hypothetical protein